MNNKLAQLKHWLALYHIPKLGVRTYHKLLNAFNSPENILSATDTQLTQAGLASAPLKSLRSFINSTNSKITDKINQDLAWFKRSEKNHIITLADASYPPLLKLIADAPVILYVKGQLACLLKHQIAMVGSRHPTIAGINHAKAFAKQLSLSNLVVTSGLAAGIDNASHQGAVAADCSTIAVMGTGIDLIYPSSAKSLATQITQQGAIISEFPLGTQPLAANFPRRNRIIAGMSLGTLVVEAALKSGSLITANLAADFNREVFAIPGAINSPVSTGCNHLIRNGAKLVDKVDDICQELNMLAVQHDDLLLEVNAATADLTPRQQQLLVAIGHSSVNTDHIIEHSKLPIDQVQQLLVELELDGLICRSAGGYMRNPSYTK
jgi:DNA processing protein